MLHQVGVSFDLIINTYVNLMYELEKFGKVLTNKSVGIGPLSYESRIYRATASQKLRNTAPEEWLIRCQNDPLNEVHSLRRCGEILCAKLPAKLRAETCNTEL